MQTEPTPLLTDERLERANVQNLIDRHAQSWLALAEDCAAKMATAHPWTRFFLRLRARQALRFRARLLVRRDVIRLGLD